MTLSCLHSRSPGVPKNSLAAVPSPLILQRRNSRFGAFWKDSFLEWTESFRLSFRLATIRQVRGSDEWKRGL
jgi:hypothetical protein